MDEDRRILVDDIDDADVGVDVEYVGDTDVIDDEEAKVQVEKVETCLNIVHLASLVAAIGGLLFGYDVGIISGAKVQVAHELGLTCGQEEALVSLMPMGALSASLVAANLLKRIGRRNTIQLTAVGFTSGSLVMAMAQSLSTLLIGRFIVGFAVSMSAMSECLYISEISRPNNRGMLVSLNELGITIGFLIAFTVNYILIDTAGGWRIMFGLSSGLAVLQFVALFFLPRTPHYLLLNKRDNEAVDVLRRIHTRGSVKQELANIRHSIDNDSSKESSCSELFSSEDNMRWRTFIGLGLIILLQVTGQPNILYYATDIFQSVGFCSPTMSAMATVGVGLVKVGATIISLILVDRVGRRTLLLVGTFLMMVALLAMTVFAGYQYAESGYHQRETCTHATSKFNHGIDNTTNINISEHVHTNAFLGGIDGGRHSDDRACENLSLPVGLRYLAFFSVVIYVAAFSFSFGPVTWIILTEVFPVSLKGNAMSLGQAVNWTANVFVSVTFLDSVRVFTLPAVLSVYFGFSVIALVFIYWAVPETKGKSLELISKELRTAPRQPGIERRPYGGSFPSSQTRSQFRLVSSSNSNSPT